MALEVNSQNLFQNAQFQQFVDFAEAAAKAGKQKAVARVDAGELGGIVNRTIRPGSGDWVGIGAGLSTFLSPLEKEAGNAIVKAGDALIVLSIADWALGHSHDHLEAWP